MVPNLVGCHWRLSRHLIDVSPLNRYGLVVPFRSGRSWWSFTPSLTTSSTAMAKEQSDFINCPICNNLFAPNEVESHIDSDHFDKSNGVGTEFPLLCPICSLEFQLESDLVFHSQLHFEDGEGTSSQSANIGDGKDDELVALQAEYGMLEDGVSYVRQADHRLTNDLYSNRLGMNDYFNQQHKVKMARIVGIEDPTHPVANLLVNIRTLSQMDSDVAEVRLATAVDHFSASRGDSGWGCGYRNCQMLMSSLRHDPQCCRNLFGDSATNIPSVPKIQKLIEEAWQKGFDSVGAEQLNFKLSDTRKWIGATEVAALLHSFHIAAGLVDFHKYSGEGKTHPALMDYLWNHFDQTNGFVPPVYIQHAGHSRTVIGVERLENGSKRLLIFDPSHRRDRMEVLKASKGPKSLMILRKGIRDMQMTQYQLVVVKGVMQSDVEWDECKKSIPLEIICGLSSLSFKRICQVSGCQWEKKNLPRPIRSRICSQKASLQSGVKKEATCRGAPSITLPHHISGGGVLPYQWWCVFTSDFVSGLCWKLPVSRQRSHSGQVDSSMVVDVTPFDSLTHQQLHAYLRSDERMGIGGCRPPASQQH